MIKTMIMATNVVFHPLLASALVSHVQFNFAIAYATPEMNRFLRLMKEPVIESIIVRIRETTYSAGISSRIFCLKKGVILRMSAIKMKNITKTMNKTIASVTEIFVFSLWRFSPKKVPITFCQTGEIITVSFHGLSFANCLMSAAFMGLSVLAAVLSMAPVVSVTSSARINGVTNRSNRINIVNPLFM